MMKILLFLFALMLMFCSSKQTTALSGNITVVGTSKVGDKSLMTLRLSDLLFDAIDHSCIYTVNGIVDYEIWANQYE